MDSPPKHSSSNYAWPWDFHISNQMFFTDFHCLQYLCLATAAADLFGRNFSVLTFNVFSSWVLLVVVFALQCNQGSSHWGGPWSPNLHFQTKQDPTVSVSNIRDIAFYECSEIILWTEISGFLSFMQQFLDSLRRLFIFSNYIREIDHFKLDLLKRFDT